MRRPDLSNQRYLTWTLVAVLVALIVGRLALSEYGMDDGPWFRWSLALIYIVMLLLVVLGVRHVWRSRDVLRPGR